jgi:hypothetical protein
MDPDSFPDLKNLSFAEALAVVLLGFVVWLIQRQLRQSSKMDDSFKKSVDAALKAHELRLRDLELRAEAAVDRKALDEIIGRALQPLSQAMVAIRGLLDKILLKQGGE